MGQITVIGGTKGGTSKTTLAENLAAWLAECGEHVFLVDCDGNANAANWASRRLSNHPDAARIDSARAAYTPGEKVGEYAHKLVGMLRALSRNAHVIADCGGYDNPALRSALGAADKLYCPLRVGQNDLDTAPVVVDLVNTARAVQARDFPAHFILTQAETNLFIQDELDSAIDYLRQEAFSALELVPFCIHARRAYREGSTEGLGVIELKGAKYKKAHDEVAAFAQHAFGTGVVPHHKGKTDAVSAAI